MSPVLTAAGPPGANREDAISPISEQRDEMLERIRGGLRAVAVLIASPTLFFGLNQQLAIPDRLAKATSCVARLRAGNGNQSDESRSGRGRATIRDVIASHHEFMF